MAPRERLQTGFASVIEAGSTFMPSDESMGKVALVVLGMHRSGTSAVAGALGEAGVDFGSKLMPANPDANAKGFFEHTGVVQVHDRILESLGSRWDDPRPFFDGWTGVEEVDEHRNALARMLGEDFSSSSVWGVKDPRICRLLPLWRSVFSALECEPRYCFVFRHPLEVVLSLQNRMSLHAPMAAEKAGALYLLHVLESEEATRGGRRTSVRYEDALRQPASFAVGILDRLGVSIGRVAGDGGHAFVDEELRHHRASAGGWDGYPEHWTKPLLQQLWRLLSREGEDPLGEVNRVELDEIRCRLGRQLQSEDPVLLRHIEDIERESREVKRRALDVHHAAGARETLIDSFREGARAREEHIRSLESEIARTKDAQRKREVVIESLRARNSSLDGTLTQLRNEHHAARAQLDNMLSSPSWRVTAPLRHLRRLLLRIARSPTKAVAMAEAPPVVDQVARESAAEVEPAVVPHKRSGFALEMEVALPGPSSDRDTAYFTICAKNFIAYAKTLYESLRRHHPGARFFVALCDRLDGLLDPRVEPFPIIQLGELDIPQVEEMASRYNITEFNTAIKPFVFQRIFDLGYQRVVYIDPDILICSPLAEIGEAFDRGAHAILTPHTVEPIEEGWFNDGQFLRYGIYNLGFLALANSRRTRDIVAWWSRRLQHHCTIDLENGIFVDQKWADLFPAFIEKTEVLRHEGYNVAYWNLPRRSVVKKGNDYFVNGVPLRFAHFSGNRLDDPASFSRHNPELTIDRVGDMTELLKSYSKTVCANGHEKYRSLPYAFSWDGVKGFNPHTPKLHSEAQSQSDTGGPAD